MTAIGARKGEGRHFGYCLHCVGGPFDGQTVNYPDLPKTLVLMEHPFHYHDYARQGESNVYRHVEREV